MSYEIKFKKYETDKILGFASVTFDGSFIVTDIVVRKGQNGPFVSMPSKKNKDGEYKDICFPITKQFREELYGKILSNVSQQQTKQTNAFEPPPEDDLPW